MKSELILKEKIIDELGNIFEIRIWKVPASSQKPFGFKYSLAYIVNGKRVVGYDNETGYGDHRHYGDIIEQYVFESIGKLVSDFKKDIEDYRENNK